MDGHIGEFKKSGKVFVPVGFYSNVKMFSIFSFLLILGAPSVAAQSQTNNLHEVFQSFIHVDCAQDTMKVRMTYDGERYQYKMPLHVESYLKTGNFTLGSSIYDRPCQSTNNTREKEHQLTFKVGQCGSSSIQMPYGRQVATNIYVEITPTNKLTMTRYIFGVKCSFLDQAIPASWVEAKVSGLKVNSSVEAVRMGLHDQMRFIVRPIFPAWPPGSGDQEKLQPIHSYPKKCTTTSGAKKVVVLDQGCPRYGDDGQVLSAIYQSTADRYLAHTTEIFLVTIPQILTDVVPADKLAPLQVECEIFWCTTLAIERVFGLPLCPSAAPCENYNGGQPLLRAGGVLPLHSVRLPFNLTVDMKRVGEFAPEFKAVRLPEYKPTEPACRFCCTPAEVLAVIGLIAFFVIVFVIMVAGACVLWNNQGPRRAVVSQSGAEMTDAEALVKSVST